MEKESKKESGFKKAIDMLYKSKEDLVILGLTGRTGAGCSTAAEILERAYEQLDFEFQNRKEYDTTEVQKFHIIKNYMGPERWHPFEVIEGSCVILSFVFEYGGDRGEKLIEYLENLKNQNSKIQFRIADDYKLYQDIRGMEHCFKAIKGKNLSRISSWSSLEQKEIEEYYNLYIERLPTYKKTFRSIMSRYSCNEIETSKMGDKESINHHLYTYFLQKVGNNIRSSGKPFDGEFESDKILDFPKRLGLLVDLIIERNKRKNLPTRICIDAIRNENESNYLKSQYRPYHLIAIATDEEMRRKRLKELNLAEKNSIDQMEYLGNYKAERFFYQQNIARCIELADIHIYNEQVEDPHKFFLTWQLVKYITLMIHPGLITPTRLERSMQLAYNAKLNSGCLSRQVGAIVTDKDGSVKAVGWNDVPQGQMPCNLRNVNIYMQGNHPECFSKYEMEEEKFQNTMKEIYSALEDRKLGGREFPICFKDIYNGYTKEKNQVYTRALHAEENAFLQISKYGGSGIKGGKLFVTASPCELCSKKSYQLGITDIYYIDPYPGIAERHILKFGKKEDAPQSHLFYGTIGESYVCLYKPLMSYKDELELVSAINCRETAEKGKLAFEKEPGPTDLTYKSVVFTICFNSREDIESTREVDFKVENASFTHITRQLVWTGTSYEGTELIENDEYTLTECNDKRSPYHYIIDFGGEKKDGDRVQYKLKSKVKDETQMMHPYLAHYVKYPTEELTLRLELPQDSKLVEHVVSKTYADREMQYPYPQNNEGEVQSKDENGMTVYTWNIQNPNLFYSYALEWVFMQIKD